MIFHGSCWDHGRRHPLATLAFIHSDLLGLVHEAEELEEELSQNPVPCFEHLISREVGDARFTARCAGDSGYYLRQREVGVRGWCTGAG